jgi:hypothetical protein
LLREIDLQTGGKPLFLLSGIPGTVGSGTQALWRELVAGLNSPARAFVLWPFDGTLAELATPGAVVVAETYPRAAYSTALARAAPYPIAKTQAGRRAQALEEHCSRHPGLRSTT